MNLVTKKEILFIKEQYEQVLKEEKEISKGIIKLLKRIIEGILIKEEKICGK